VDRQRNLTARDWAGPIAFVLAAGIAIAFTSVLIITAVQPTPLDVQLAGIVTALTGAAVGAVGTYLGTRAGGHAHVREDDAGDGGGGLPQ
jgi:drug/metabolite transporter (DMT)-like permease